jgi:transposase
MSPNDLVDTRRNGQAVVAVPDPEVRPKTKHRRFSAEYKKRILDEAATCTQRGELGALLRREGLYSSLLTQWRRQQAQGALAGLAPKKRGPKPDPQAEEIARLRRENERLQERLQKAETIIEVQKKVSQLLGVPPDSTSQDEPS